MDEAKVAAVVERWRKSGFGIVLKDAEYTAEEQYEILQRCETLARALRPTALLARTVYEVGDKVSILMSSDGRRQEEESGEIEITEVFPPAEGVSFYCYAGRVLKGNFSHAKDGILTVHNGEIVHNLTERRVFRG